MKAPKSNAVLNLTSGSALPLMLRFSLPLLLGNMMQQLYNMADAAVVGRIIGTNALAAVGATGSITFLIIGFVDGICAGFCIPAAQAFGAGNRSLLRRCIVNIVILGSLAAIVMTGATTVLLDHILRLMRFPDEIYPDSSAYMQVILAGIPATLAYNTQAGLMRAMGNSKTPLYILILSSLVNLVLDVTLVGAFQMGVRGAAAATVASQLLSAVVCFVYISKTYPELKPERAERRFDSHIAGRLILSGLPMALQYSITAVGSVLIQTAVNGLSTSVIAGVTAANKVLAFVYMPFNTLGVTVSTFLGQNMGAGKFDRVKDGFWKAMWIAMTLSLTAGVLIYFFGEYASLIFLDAKDPRLPEILAAIRQFLHANSLFYIPLGVLTVCRFGLQGMEYGVVAMFAGAFEMAARTSVALVFVKFWGYSAICFANPFAWIAACLLLVPSCLIVFPRAEKKVLAIHGAKGERGDSEETQGEGETQPF